MVYASLSQEDWRFRLSLFPFDIVNNLVMSVKCIIFLFPSQQGLTPFCTGSRFLDNVAF